MKRESFVAVMPTCLFLWGAMVLTSALCTEPLHRATSLTPDAEMFEPGGLFLLEAISFQGPQLLAAARVSFVLFLATALVLTVIRSRLTAVVADESAGHPARKPLFSRAPAYVGISMLYGVLLALGASLVIWTMRELPPLEGRLPAKRVTYYFTVLAVAYLLWLISTTFVDLLKLSLFHDETLPGRLRWAGRTLKRQATPLLFARAARGALTALVGWAILHLSALPVATPIGPVVTFVGSQVTIFLLLVVEVYWLLIVQDSLARSKDSLIESSGSSD